ncbi:MAG TPA: response regulator [Candidatus Paceibacterota bacterium]|nr:response regulator [Candidatus Paceibacterota bacterium]
MKKILIVEDERALLRALVEKLSRENLLVFQAGNGEEGLEMALKEHPDIILLDIVMPKMDGITMLKKLREDGWGKTAKIILLTNLSSNEKTAEALALGTNEYLIKTDWEIADVVAKVREHLEI